MIPRIFSIQIFILFLCAQTIKSSDEVVNPSTLVNTISGSYQSSNSQPFSNEAPKVPISSDNDEIDSREMMRRKYNITGNDDEGTDYEMIEIAPMFRQAFAKQIGLPSNPWGLLINRVPCNCVNGVCGCCTGMFISALRSVGCLNITYIPEDFSFEFKMIMNDAVLYKNRVTGRNPPPVCARVPRFNFMKVCASFYDLYFIGRNMHVCLDMSAFIQDYEIFNRSFDCMRIGDKGVKIVGPEDGGGLISKPGTDAEIDAGFDPIDDYDENVVRKARHFDSVQTS